MSSFAGFNTAVLSEIGKQLQRSIELVQVDSIGWSMVLFGTCAKGCTG